jgi:hypothetical protein
MFKFIRDWLYSADPWPVAMGKLALVWFLTWVFFAALMFLLILLWQIIF